MPEESGIQMARSLKGWRAEVGMLAPTSWMYREFGLVAPEGIKFSTGVLGVEGNTPEQLKDMVKTIEVEAKKINLGRKCDLVCLGCTTGTLIGGPGYDQQLIERIEKASGSPATTTATCVLEIFKDMNVKKIVLVGPYLQETVDIELKFFEYHGIKTLWSKVLGLGPIAEYWTYGNDPETVYRLVKEGAKMAAEADCIFASCMCTHIVGIVDMLEAEIGKPIVSSPSATLYGILKKLGISDPVYHFGEALRGPRLTS
jgi:maleate isomerase